MSSSDVVMYLVSAESDRDIGQCTTPPPPAPHILSQMFLEILIYFIFLAEKDGSQKTPMFLRHQHRRHPRGTGGDAAVC